MKSSRILLSLLLLIQSSFTGLVGCSNPGSPSSDRSSPPTRIHTSGTTVDLESFDVDPHSGDVLVELQVDPEREALPRQLRLSSTRGAKPHFSISLRDLGGRELYTFALEDDVEHGRGTVVQRREGCELRQQAEIRDGRVLRTRAWLDGRLVHTADGPLEVAKGVPSLPSVEGSVLAQALPERALVRDLLQSPEFLHWLRARGAELAPAGVTPDTPNLASLTLKPDAAGLTCAMATLLSLTCFCLVLPICWAPCVPSIGVSIACAIATIVDWIDGL